MGAPWIFMGFGMACFLCLALLAGCADSGSSRVAVSSRSSTLNPADSPKLPAQPSVSSDTGFLTSEIASEAAEYIRLGRESMQDSSWFDASEYFDSAMVGLADLEANDSLNPNIRVAAQAYQDSVREWQVLAVSQSNRLGEAVDLSELLNQEIEEVPDSEVKDLAAELKGLPDRSFDLPLPSPLPQPVLQALHVFIGPGRGYFTHWLQRRSRYSDMITAKLAERGMPKDLLYLSMVESGFSSKAWSRKSASGLWQFISGTGRRYGLKDDWWEDPRRDPALATEAALDYLEDLYAEFSDWNLAMAAYNCGEGRIRKQREQNPGSAYWDMNLPEETRFYVPKILAAMIIGHNPAFFGFKPGEAEEKPLSFDTVVVHQCLSLGSIARVVGITEDSLKDLNPALRRWCTPPGRKGFVLNLPEGSRSRFYTNYDRIDTLVVASWQRHVVKRRETLARIASQYGISVASIQEANHLKNIHVRRGQSLIIPAPTAMRTGRSHVATASRYKVHRGETLYDIARRFQVSVSTLREINGLGHVSTLHAGRVLKIPAKPLDGEQNDEATAQPVVASVRHTTTHAVHKGKAGISDSNSNQEQENMSLASVDAPQYYQVKTGDSLWDISVRFGCSLDALKKLNDNLSKKLRPGQKIRVR